MSQNYVTVYAINPCIALQEAIRWCFALDLHNVQFESDSLQVINAVKNAQVDYSDFGLLVADCLALSKQRSDFSFHFTRRLANGCAHDLAKAALCYAGPTTFTFPPLLLGRSLSVDLQ